MRVLAMLALLALGTMQAGCFALGYEKVAGGPSNDTSPADAQRGGGDSAETGDADHADRADPVSADGATSDATAPDAQANDGTPSDGSATDGAVSDGSEGSPCISVDDCDALSAAICSQAGVCQDGSEGDPCEGPLECGDGSPICSQRDGRCHDGDQGDPCKYESHCSGALRCGPALTCQVGAEGDACEGQDDCGDNAAICSAAGICQDGSEGDACESTLDCDDTNAPLCGDGSLCRQPVALPGADVAEFADSFSGDALGDAWAASEEGDGCTIGTPGGNIQFSMNGQVGRCELTTEYVYDLQGGSVDVEIPAITSYYAPMRVFLAVVDEEGNRVELAFHDGYFEGLARVGDTTVFDDTSAYEPEPRYWRIRSSGDEIALESSVTGSSWDIEMVLDRPFDLSRVHLAFGVEVLSAMPGSVGIGVPAFNTASD